jgi:hypothetical protein
MIKKKPTIADLRILIARRISELEVAVKRYTRDCVAIDRTENERRIAQKSLNPAERALTHNKNLLDELS